MDLVFVVDSSGSIRDNNPSDYSYDNWQLILDFMDSVITSLQYIGPQTNQVGVVTFADTARNELFLNETNNCQELVSRVHQLNYFGGNTRTSEGLRFMSEIQFTAENGDRPGAENIAIVLIDGVSTVNASGTLPQASLAHDKGIHILAVGITDRVNTDELRGISSPPHEEGVTCWRTPDFQTLSNLLQPIIIALNICFTGTRVHGHSVHVAAPFPIHGELATIKHEKLIEQFLFIKTIVKQSCE